MNALWAVALVVTGWLFSAAAMAVDIVIAQVGPFSGPLAVNGEANYVGAKACFDKVNAQGGIDGRRIRFIREDDGYKPAETIRLLRLVAERDKPVAFINLFGSANASAVIKDQTLEQLGIPVVGLTPGSEALREPGSTHLFHLQAGDRVQLRAMLSHLSTIGISRVAVVLQDNPFGEGGLKFIEQMAPGKGLTVVGTFAVPIGAEDAKAAATALRRFNVQAYLMVLAPNSGAAFVRDVRGSGDSTPIYGMSYVTAQGVVGKAGLEKAVGVALTQVAPNPSIPTTGLTREFHAAMRAHAPKDAELTSMSLAGYLAARVTVEAIKRSRGASAPAVEAALRGLKLDLGGYTVDFSDGGNVGSHMVEIGVIGRSGDLRY